MNLVVIGAQWGDEGKGKVVDYLSDGADVTVRFSGGANAGHTIVRDDKVYKLHLVPSGIVTPDKTVVLGSGMVIDPEALFAELHELTNLGVLWEGRVLISDRAHVVLPAYRQLDVELDQKRAEPIGTTGRGIGVAYSRKAMRDGYRMVDILEQDVFETIDAQDREFLEQYRAPLADMVIDIQRYMELKGNKTVLLEGAQGALLDLDLGTYPYVSSGCSAAAGASLGSGIGPRAIDRVVGVFKAYSTRVGNGPFPSEFQPNRDGRLTEHIREVGNEYGVTTGRPRRCGYLDLVALRYICRSNSIDSLALTHIDVYDDLDEVKVCVAYDIEQSSIDSFPASRGALNKAQPVTKRFAGWKTSLSGVTSYKDLPVAAQDYIAFIEQYTGVPVDIVSVGADRQQTIVRRDPWTQS
ncbi:MAG: adenylosuccinate synthase [Spirochaetaceae bacterium]|nr:MAG: adenylosuccinate synthase [Spirochaetaceae bacterium]